jgi:benzodiazapine receptor
MKLLSRKEYQEYKKPRWSPPAWLFAPVWTTLYILITISFGYVAYLCFSSRISFIILLPFLLNLAFNFAYTTIQFRFHNFTLATLDVVLVLVTLIWAFVAIYSIASWVAYINLPYLAWVCFATVLQLKVTAMNRS